MSLLLTGLLIKTLWVAVGLVLIVLAVKYNKVLFKEIVDVEEEIQKDNLSVAIVVGAFIVGICIFLGLIL
jgi:uncharacterized membrane protein YjfL (UPF0719 family)